MNIQSNINQITSIASLLLSQTPMAANRKRALEIQGKAVAGSESLKGIYGQYKKLEAGEIQPYSDVELSDIEGRISSNIHDIYTGTIAADDPNLKNYIDKTKFGSRRDEILPESKTSRSEALAEMSNFREANRLAAVRQASKKAAEGIEASNLERQASNDFINKIKNAESLD